MSDDSPVVRSLTALAAAEAVCTRCPLYQFATQAVPGEGTVHSRLMLVGEQRGKRRLHKRPNSYEIERCQWWLDRERAIVKPAAIVTLGATAARSLFGR